MVEVSVVIPGKNERFLTATIEDILRKAELEIEVIAVLDNCWPDEFVDDPRVHYIHLGQDRGMRASINAGVAVAKGEWLIKCDAHCAFDQGFDRILTETIEYDWVVVPRRYSLNTDTWGPQKHQIDYLYLCYPIDPNDRGGASLHGRLWNEKNRDKTLEEIPVDDLMSAQGSCWVMNRGYFHWLQLEDEEEYGTFGNEFQEIGLKCWLSGGRVVRNKLTWYCHLHKGRKWGRGYRLSQTEVVKAATKTKLWMKGRNWFRQDRDLRWLIWKFWPVPGWPEEAVRLVFHRRRGGSGQIRGLQVADYFQARLNPQEDWWYDFDVHVWVKQQPDDITLPGRHYLDVLDEPRRIPWLREHPECGVIASSESSLHYLVEKLGRKDIILIPQHHVNFNRVHRPHREVRVAGVVGGQGAIQLDVEELRSVLGHFGIEFRWLQRYSNPDQIVQFYQGLDLQIVWRTQQRPMKNPLKLVNAMSFGIPTIAFPEVAYQEVHNFYWPAEDMDGIVKAVDEIKGGWSADRLIEASERYHIHNVSQLYRRLLV